MIVLDDVIAVRHLITCYNCVATYSNINDWLNHKKNTNHQKELHTVAIVGEGYENVHIFNKNL